MIKIFTYAFLFCLNTIGLWTVQFHPSYIFHSKSIRNTLKTPLLLCATEFKYQSIKFNYNEIFMERAYSFISTCNMHTKLEVSQICSKCTLLLESLLKIISKRFKTYFVKTKFIFLFLITLLSLWKIIEFMYYILYFHNKMI